MALEDQKRWIILVVAARRTFKFLPLTKITKLMPASYLFPFISACMLRTKGNLVSGDLVSMWTQTDFGGIFKIIQVYERLYDGANKMQMEQNWVITQTVPYSEKTGNNKYYDEKTEPENWQSEISPEYWR